MPPIRPPALPQGSLVRSTVRALLEPRRLAPILLVCAPMVAAQSRYSEDPLAVPLALLMCALFVLFAPLAWRVLFPERLPASQGAVRLVLYAALGAGIVLTTGLVLPGLLGMGHTFLTQRPTLLVAGALFLVGGWGLGRDIGLTATLARERARAEALARAAEGAQLLALRSHLDPHFLFNTLNAIAEWCREDGAVAERAVLQLSEMLRAVLAGVRASTWPLEQELALVETLFALHLLRDPQRFTFALQVPPEVRALPVPPLLLLPLAENAVKHGPAAGHAGALRLTAEPHGASHVLLQLENPGPYRGPREGSDGLPTLQRRLALAYGGQATLRLEEQGGRTCASLLLPREGPLPDVLT
ncbi:sensor histidine kinase [Aggregicoccus sp. 17bor-14]|uniref:sensor histidine kinase n=1 Tax=Myxococcaceae TaxID=31 RepID=UPI00129CD996|nr:MULTISPECIES: histidine kinase [Myxococcaceae]MBF5041953.1 histidine kinase [Simulacricoccus sp. 17bor-14]MRI87734.1 sensor histidine kinase [Aggregicoccus sp. 17bor-14]